MWLCYHYLVLIAPFLPPFWKEAENLFQTFSVAELLTTPAITLTQTWLYTHFIQSSGKKNSHDSLADQTYLWSSSQKASEE